MAKRQFKRGDRVIVHRARGDIEAIFERYPYSHKEIRFVMVLYVGEDGRGKWPERRVPVGSVSWKDAAP